MLRQLLLLLKLPPRQSLPLLKLPLRQSSKHQPPLRSFKLHGSFKHHRLKRQLLLLLRRWPPRHQLPHQDQLFPAEPLRANQRVMPLAKHHAPLHHDLTRSALRPVVAHLVLLVAPLLHRLVTRSVQLVVPFRRLLVVP